MSAAPKPERQQKSNKKSKEELQAEQEAAKAQLESLLASSRPKNLQQGLKSGVSDVTAGALGALGLLVLAPTVGCTEGAKNGGVIGAVFGAAGGVVVGAIGGVALAVGGAVQGVTQVARGVAAVPSSITEPRKGNWWNENEGTWIETNLDTEAKNLQSVPKDDYDILGEAKAEAAVAATKKEEGVDVRDVADMFYYDVLDVDPSADHSKIKRQYYFLARKYHPDKVGKDDIEAANKFKDIAEAYHVLSDTTLRKKYDKEGRDGLSADKTSLADQGQIDPAILFAFLFGSDKFDDYVGKLSMATSAMIGDSTKVSVSDARKLQKRRVTRLAIKLADRLQMWTADDTEGATNKWKSEADELSMASYGSELVKLIGKVYSLSAVQFLGSIDSGIGMPSISKWAASHRAEMKTSSGKSHSQYDTLKAGVNMVLIDQMATADLGNAKTDEEKAAAQARHEKAMHTALLQVMWTTTVVDITSTLHEACQMLLFDKAVEKDIRKKRGKGLKKLGEVFMECSVKDETGDRDAQRLYEEAAFAAMLETVKRKDEAAHSASFRL